MSDVTKVLDRIEIGDPGGPEDLLPLVYEELRTLASNRMSLERFSHTLQATALVHEAYLRLIASPQGLHWDSKGHFFAAAAEAMRRILIEHARRKNCGKRGAGFTRVDLAQCDLDHRSELTLDEILSLDDAVQNLEQEDQEVAQLVRLRLYAGLSVTEASKVMDISRSTAYEYWEYALAWFAAELA